jgi:hypothetical protein
MMKLLVLLAVPAVSTAQQQGAALWFEWVTDQQRVTQWDNSAQLASEKRHPSKDPKDRHPYAAETRWGIDGLVSEAPKGWNFAMLEIGDSFFCAPDRCEFTLFGLETVNVTDVRLHSFATYGNDAAVKAIDALHANHAVNTTIIRYADMVLNPIEIIYRYGFNSTANATVFYGEGRGPTSSGGVLVVQETVAPTYVAPLELFYDASGTLQTTYDTPIVYKRLHGA